MSYKPPLIDADFSALERYIAARLPTGKAARVITAHDEFSSAYNEAINQMVLAMPNSNNPMWPRTQRQLPPRQPTTPIFQQNSVHKLEALEIGRAHV